MEQVGSQPEDLQRAVGALRAGLVVAYPTETFYGLAADAWQPAALQRLLALKGRTGAPLSLILAHPEQLDRVVEQVPAAARVLMDRHWPGPLTLVLPARADVPAPLVGPAGVGVRLSPHPVACELARLLDAPLVATSANRSGEPPASTAGEVARGLPGVDLVLDGGATAGGAPSTVVAMDAAGTLSVLRRGAIHVGA